MARKMVPPFEQEQNYKPIPVAMQSGTPVVVASETSAALGTLAANTIYRVSSSNNAWYLFGDDSVEATATTGMSFVKGNDLFWFTGRHTHVSVLKQSGESDGKVIFTPCFSEGPA